MQTVTPEYIEANRTKRHKARCPSCGGNDLYYTYRNNRAHCFECREHYRIVDNDGAMRENAYQRPLDVERIRDMYATLSGIYTKQLDQRAHAFLQQRGLDTQEIIDWFQIGYCPIMVMNIYRDPMAKDAGIAKRDDTPFLADRIIFPYIGEHNCVDVRGRAIDPNEPLRYKSPYHPSPVRGAVYPFNYDRAIERAERTKLIIITEGEIKAIFADLHDFAAVGLPGMTNWRRGLMLNSDIRPIIIFDSVADKTEQLRVDRAIALTAAHLNKAHVVKLPLLGEHKMDLDTFFLHKRGGYNRFKQYVDEAMPVDQYMRLRSF